MCIVCVLTALTSLFMLAPARSGHQTRKIAEFNSLIAPYLPADERGAEACRALGTRLTAVPAEIEWRTFSRPNERRLVAEAERAADRVFNDVRAALLGDDGARARAVDGLAAFYGRLAAYPGEGGRALRRTAAIGATTTLPLLLLAAGFYVAEFPELCGAAPDLFGGHAAHILVGLGSAGVVGLMGLVAPRAGRAWLIDVGTAEADQAAGARRAEDVFWRRVITKWSQDAELGALLTGPPDQVARQLLDRLNGAGTGLLEACEGQLRLAPPDTSPDTTTRPCAKCAG